VTGLRPDTSRGIPDTTEKHSFVAKWNFADNCVPKQSLPAWCRQGNKRSILISSPPCPPLLIRRGGGGVSRRR